MTKETVREQLIRHEEYREKLYKDSVGKWTIGVGHNIEDKGLHPEVIDLQLDIDIYEASDDCKTLYGVIYTEMRYNRQRVLINMMFNLGYNKLKGFKKFKRALELGDYDTAADEMLDSKWATQVGSRATELAEQMRKG